MMKIEAPTSTGSSRFDEIAISSFTSPAIVDYDSEQIVELKMENVRLRRLVAELLVKNQQLRQRYCGSRKDSECAELSAAHNYHRREN